ncbi:MAG: LysM peptidoglycan-binding domain-containing protein [Bdellovibrionaceae bacterium]|nr:LysM peptidoglycan-binding domain-containing protein [Pseudobdellovibrionaceae bacterium]
MKWILYFTVAMATVSSLIFYPKYSFAQDENGFEDFDEEFGGDQESVEESSSDDFSFDENKEDFDENETVEGDANQEDDEDFFAEEEEPKDDKKEDKVATPEPVQEPEPNLLKENDTEKLQSSTVNPEDSEINENNENNLPDLQYEAKLYDIYIKYNSAPMSDEEWDYIAGAKMSEVYTIQKGDTLWHLSKTFFGDGNYWPKIWSVNSKIKNPHLIEPLNVIRFVLGSENDPPMFTVTEGKSQKGQEENFPAEEQNLDVTIEDAQLEDLAKEVGKLEKELTEEFSEAQLEEEFMSDEEIEGIVIPPPEKIIRPVTQVFPPSLPQWKSLADSVLESSTIEVLDKKPDLKPHTVTLSYYIDENQPEGIGKIVGVEGGGTVAAQFQYVYVRAKKDSIKEGDKYLVVEKQGPIKTEKGVQEDAIVWEVQGQIIVGQKLEATKKYRSKDFDVYRASVASSITAIRVDAEIVHSDYTLVTLDNKGRIPPVSGLIIGGEFNTKRNLLSKESIAFLNVGSHEGVQTGDILPIYSNHYLEQLDPYVITTKKPMGLIKIAKATEFYSTGFVIENNGSINVGDFVGLKEGFEREYLGKAVYEKVQKEKADKELEELQSLIQVDEEEVDPAETESYEYISE